MQHKAEVKKAQESFLDLKVSGKYLTTQSALTVSRAAGGPRGIVTLHRWARENDMLFQPRGKRGECFIDKKKLIALLTTG